MCFHTSKDPGCAKGTFYPLGTFVGHIIDLKIEEKNIFFIHSRLLIS